MNILRIHRITLAVQHADSAGDTFAALFGERAGPVELVREFGVRSVDVPLGDALLQLVSPPPVDPDNAVRRFLQRKGEGFYNVALEVDDLDAAIAELAQKGVRVSEPVEAEPGIRSAFVTMAATHGLSVQLVELTGGGKRETSDGMRDDTGIATTTQTFERPRAEHLPPIVEPEPAPISTPHPAALAAADWADAGAPVLPSRGVPASHPPSAATAEPAAPPAAEEPAPPPPLLDLTPDEWSDDD